MNSKIFYLGLALTSCVATSCVDEEVTSQGGTDAGVGQQSYVVAATVDGVNYLVTTPSLDEGEISVVGKGLETESGTYWVFYGNKYLFRLVYNKGGQGTGSSYILNSSKKMEEYLQYSVNRITTYGLWGENVIIVSAGDTSTKDADGDAAKGLLVNYLNANTGLTTSKAYICEDFLGNGEYVTFSGFVEANGKLYTSVIPMGMSRYGVKAFSDKITDTELIAKASGGSGSGSYVAGEIPSTQYPDCAYVAIYSGDNFSNAPIIASTDKMGFASGRMKSQYYQTIWSADNGDVYVFSPGYGRLTTSSEDLKRVEGKLPSGVMRIKAGSTSFDDSYYVNLEELGNKNPMYKCWHIKDDYFLLQLYTQGLNSKGEYTTELAVFKGESKQLTVVTGLPDESQISSFGNIPYCENGFIYMPVSILNGNPSLYKINPETGVATKGLSITAESVSTVGKLDVLEDN